VDDQFYFLSVNLGFVGGSLCSFDHFVLIIYAEQGLRLDERGCLGVLSSWLLLDVLRRGFLEALSEFGVISLCIESLWFVCKFSLCPSRLPLI
jgi:hypothetical protein